MIELRRMKRGRKTKEGTRIHLMLAEDLLDDLDRYAKDNSLTRTAAIEGFIRDGLDSQKYKDLIDDLKDKNNLKDDDIVTVSILKEFLNTYSINSKSGK